jgi:dolichol-phosphate mannosyltransferase
MSTLSILSSFWIVYGSLKWGFTVIGWPSLMSTIFFSTGVILVVLGIMGIYLGEIFKQVKNRPLYIISERKNFESSK